MAVRAIHSLLRGSQIVGLLFHTSSPESPYVQYERLNYILQYPKYWYILTIRLFNIIG